LAVDPRKVLPTKINLIRLRRELKSVRRIRKVLEEKRSALILYAKAMIEEYERAYSSVAEELGRAYSSFERAALLAGYERIKELGDLTPPTALVSVKERVAFAVRVPVIEVEAGAAPSLGVAGVPPGLVEAAAELRKALSSYMKLVELEYSIRRVLDELRRTQRLINAVDHVILPSLEKTVKHIKLVLDERAREEFTRLKIMKRKRQKV